MANIQHEQFTSRTAFALAAIGCAVGLGNVWRFPYLTGVSGGAAFLLVYVICVLVIAIPLLMAEIMIGRRGRQSPQNSMLRLSVENNCSRKWRAVGWIGPIAVFLILSYYSVVAGWTLDYIVTSLLGGFENIDGDNSQQRFNSLLANPTRLSLWHTVFMALTCIVSSLGVIKGIERATGLLMPILFIILLLIVVYSLMEGSVDSAIRFLFEVNFDKIDAKVVLAAIGQAFFSMGIALGTMMTYGAYLSKDASIPRLAGIIVVADTGVSLLAGLAIFPIVFAHGLDPAEGPGLIFVTLPIAFGNMTGGAIIGLLFFLLLFFAAFTTSLASVEPIATWLMEEKSLSRKSAVMITTTAVWAFGFLSLFSFNIWADLTPLGMFTIFEDKNFYGIIEDVTANLMMPIGGILVAVFAGWKMSNSSIKEELGMSAIGYKLWHVLIKYFVPIFVSLILFYSFM